jgi:kynurenine 3-monooxygenase
LRRAGLAEDAIHRVGVPVRAQHFFFKGGDRVKRLPEALSYVAIGRDELVSSLIELAESHGAQFLFDSSCIDVDLDARQASFRDRVGQTTATTSDVILFADGAFSLGRSIFQRRVRRFESSQTFHRHGYKTLLFPEATKRGFDPSEVLFFAGGNKFLANGTFLPGDTLVVTLCLPYHGGESLEMSDPAAVRVFFEKHLPLLAQRHDALADEFLRNPAGDFVTVRCSTFHDRDVALLLGDAAHAVVPFAGLGLNLCIEDVDALDRLLDEHRDDWGATLAGFTRTRVPEAEAVAEISLENYRLLDGSNLTELLRREYAAKMHRVLPRMYPPGLDTLTAFTDLPFSEIRRLQRDINRRPAIARL